MRHRQTRVVMTILIALSACNLADAGESKPILCRKGKLLLDESFAMEKIDSRWSMNKGAWKIVDGALQGTELEKDNHAASIRTAIELPGTLVMQFDFRFDGGTVIHCSFNGKGHICRATITPTGFTLKGEKVKKDPDDKSVTVGQVQQTYKKGEWYTMRVEIGGQEFVAQVDDGPVAFGAHAKVARAKNNFGFPMAGVNSRIDNIRIWEAKVNPNWASIKSKLPVNKIVPPAPPTPKQRFDRLDKNHDGALSLKEFIGARPKDKRELAEKQFGRRDKDGNGSLSLSEYLPVPKPSK